MQKIFGRTINSLLFLSSLVLSSSANGAALQTVYGPVKKDASDLIRYEALQQALSQTESVVFDDESEGLFGDIKENDLHGALLCQVLEKVAKARPKAIVLDIEIWGTKEDRDCIRRVIIENRTFLVMNQFPQKVLGVSRSEEAFFGQGHASIWTHSMNQNKKQDLRESNSEDRIRAVLPSFIPTLSPMYFLALVKGVEEAMLSELNYLWTSRITLADFSEERVPKTSFQEALKKEPDWDLSSKTVFVGIDQDRYDSFSNAKGEIVNGVFLHAHFFAAYMALLKGDLVLPLHKKSPILFGDLNTEGLEPEEELEAKN